MRYSCRQTYLLTVQTGSCTLDGINQVQLCTISRFGVLDPCRSRCSRKGTVFHPSAGLHFTHLSPMTPVSCGTCISPWSPLCSGVGQRSCYCTRETAPAIWPCISGWGVLIDVSSPVHDPHCAGEILFLYWYPCEFLFCFLIEGDGRSRWENPRARERAMDVLCRSPSAWCRPAYDQTVNVRDCFSQQPYSP